MIKKWAYVLGLGLLFSASQAGATNSPYDQATTDVVAGTATRRLSGEFMVYQSTKSNILSPTILISGPKNLVQSPDLQATYGLLASTASLTGTGDTLYSLITSSGIHVLAGEVVATGFVGHLYGTADTATTVTTNANLTGPITSVGNATTIAGPVSVSKIDLSTFPYTGSCTLPQVVRVLNAGAAPTCTEPSDTTGNSATATALATAGSAASSGFLCRGEDASGNCLPASTNATTSGVSGSTLPWTAGAAFTTDALNAKLAGATFTGASGITNNAFTATGANGNFIGSSSFTTTGGLFGNGGALTGVPSSASIVGIYARLDGATFTGAVGITNQALTLTGASGNVVSGSSITTGGGVFGTDVTASSTVTAGWIQSSSFTTAGAFSALSTNSCGLPDYTFTTHRNAGLSYDSGSGGLKLCYSGSNRLEAWGSGVVLGGFTTNNPNLNGTSGVMSMTRPGYSVYDVGSAAQTNLAGYSIVSGTLAFISNGANLGYWGPVSGLVLNTLSTMTILGTDTNGRSLLVQGTVFISSGGLFGGPVATDQAQAMLNVVGLTSTTLLGVGNGSVGRPSIAFNSMPTSGWYSDGTQWLFSGAGTNRWSLTNGGALAGGTSGAVALGTGLTAAAPAYSFRGNLGAGLSAPTSQLTLVFSSSATAFMVAQSTGGTTPSALSVTFPAAVGTGDTVGGTTVTFNGSDANGYGIKVTSGILAGTLTVGTSTGITNNLVLLSSAPGKGSLLNPMSTTERDAISNPPSGLLVYNTTTLAYNYYNGTAWTAFGTGSGGTSTMTVTWIMDDFTASANGVTTAFNLTQLPSTAQAIEVYLDGLALLQGTGKDYTYNGVQQITITTAPPTGSSSFFVRYAINTATAPAIASLGWVRDEFIGSVTGSQYVFTLSQTPSSSTAIMIIQDGLLQASTSDYTYTPPVTITMATAPAANTYSFFAKYTVNTTTQSAAALLNSANGFTAANTFSGPTANVEFDSSATFKGGLFAQVASLTSTTGPYDLTTSTGINILHGALAFGADAYILWANGSTSTMAGIPQNSQSAAYTTILSDANKHILHPGSDASARNFTIDSNANVAYPIGTAITFVNGHGAGVVTIKITSDTMYLAGAGTTGDRTLAADGIATAIKISATVWLISGTGLT